MPSDLQNVDRDVFNEKPSKEDIIAVPEGQGKILKKTIFCFDFIDEIIFQEDSRSFTIPPQYTRHVEIFTWNCLPLNVQNRWKTSVCTAKMAIITGIFSIVSSKDSWSKLEIQLVQERVVNLFGAVISRMNSIHRWDMIDLTLYRWQMLAQTPMAASFLSQFYQRFVEFLIEIFDETK